MLHLFYSSGEKSVTRVGGGFVTFLGFKLSRLRAPRLRDILIHLTLMTATLAVAEVILRVADLRELRNGYGAGYPIVFQHDAALGWTPIPKSSGKFHGSRDISVQHNSLGLRDVEHGSTRRPTILFLGDSYVWGYDVEAKDRFTEHLRDDLPGMRIVNAGVPGYGTDQEYLLLERLWNRFKPDVVVLMFCTDNDRDDNSTNMRSDGYYKPYFAPTADGTLRLAGQPVPKSRQVYFNDDPVVRNLWLARAVMTGYVYLRYPRIAVPDPTERLVGMMQDFVESHGAKFLVGLENLDLQLVQFLQARKIPWNDFRGTDHFHVDAAEVSSAAWAASWAPAAG